MRSRSVLLASLALALALAATTLACDEPGPDATRKVVRIAPEGAGHKVAPVQIARVWRPALELALAEDGSAQVQLGQLSDGILETHVGVLESASGDVTGRVRLQPVAGAREEEGCNFEWRAGESSWAPCRFVVPPSSDRLELVIEVDSPVSGQWFIAEPTLVRTGRPTKPVVFVIVIDTVRAGSPLTVGSSGGITVKQGLSSLQADGISFDNARAPSSWTRTSVATLLTGLSPHGHRVYGRWDRLSSEIRTLQGTLRDAGYGTAAWSTNPNILPVWGFGRGFDAFADVTAGKVDATAVFDRVEQTLLRNRDDPYLYYVHLMDAHFPYRPDEKMLKRVQGANELRQHKGKVRKLYASYLAEMLGMEERIGQFISFLVDLGLYEQSLILIASDHGEEFFEHGRHWHGDGLYEEVLRIPVFLKLPHGRHAGTRERGVIGLAGMMPTILQAVGIAPPRLGSGRSLLDSEGNYRGADAEFSVASLILDGRAMDAILQDNWKFILDQDGEQQLFNLADDPLEAHNLVATETERASQLRTLLAAEVRLQSQGWHIVYCSPAGSSIDFNLRDVDAVRSHGFEESDLIRESAVAGDVIYEVSLTSRFQTVDSDKDTTSELKVLRHDRDELVLLGQQNAAVLESRGESVRVRLGEQTRMTEERRLVLADFEREAEIRDGLQIYCDADAFGSEGFGYLHLWYVPGSEAVARGDVGDDVIERLKALGYLH